MKVTLKDVIKCLRTPQYPKLNLAVADDIEKHGIQLDYVPMTRKELADANGWKHYGLNEYELGLVRKGEFSAIKRIGAVPPLDQAKQICEQNGYAVAPVDTLEQWAELLSKGRHRRPLWEIETMLEAAKDNP